MTLAPTRPLDLCDDFVDQMKRTFKIAEVRHALGENRFVVGSADPSAACIPDFLSSLERGQPFIELALPDQCNSRIDWHQHLCDER